MKTIFKGILTMFGMIIGLMLFVGVACSSPDVEENKIKEIKNNFKMEVTENDYVKVELLEVKEDSFFGADFKFKITNKTDDKLNINIEEAYKNDIMLDCFLYTDVLPKKSSIETVSFYNGDGFKELKELKGMTMEMKIINSKFDNLEGLKLNIK